MCQVIQYTGDFVIDRGDFFNIFFLIYSFDNWQKYHDITFKSKYTSQDKFMIIMNAQWFTVLKFFENCFNWS